MTETAPRSPCINVCVLNPAGICIGCFRSGEEIARWTSMSAAEQWQVVEAARGRGLEQRAAETGKSLFLEMTVNTTSAVTERIKQQISSGPVVLFMKGTPDFPQCGFSAQTVAALRSVGADFKHVNIFEDPELREGLKKYSNWPTYPQLYINGELVGGCDIALEMMRSGELKKLIEGVNAS